MEVTVVTYTRQITNPAGGASMQRGADITLCLADALAWIEENTRILPNFSRLEASFEGSIGFSYFDERGTCFQLVVMDVTSPADQQTAETAIEDFISTLGDKAQILQDY